ncbi:helix-turn-helix transcriptional regulator [Maritimibacter dapengensis]|uniref:YafY family transcriptional regulator n=1 Tax=Maritimibacter dapengensis TaxID=2836868 RepID=A0ABS6SXX6_9RHOB|nr:YafY family protein [Maritimibacter dapengensis]MBV7377815.1 YafY family transcriptional regulator [Maritimibacter dapengensis]
MRRADRLFQIVQYLRGGRLTRARDLAEKLEVSERTIYRDVADLIGSGVPIEGEAGVGYVMRAGYDLPPLMFNREEIVALVAGARMARTWGGLEMARAAEEALVKIEAVLPDSLRARAESVAIHSVDFLGQDPVERAKLDLLEGAADRRERIHFDYEDREGQASSRVVRPLGLFFWGRTWTLASWDEGRDDFRTFRVDRMENLTKGASFREERDKTLHAYYIQQGRRPPT